MGEVESTDVSKRVNFDRGELLDMLARKFQILEGKIKTLIEASITDGTQLKAMKDIAYGEIWHVYDDLLQMLGL